MPSQSRTRDTESHEPHYTQNTKPANEYKCFANQLDLGQNGHQFSPPTTQECYLASPPLYRNGKHRGAHKPALEGNGALLCWTGWRPTRGRCRSAGRGRSARAACWSSSRRPATRRSGMASGWPLAAPGRGMRRRRLEGITDRRWVRWGWKWNESGGGCRAKGRGQCGGFRGRLGRWMGIRWIWLDWSPYAGSVCCVPVSLCWTKKYDGLRLVKDYHASRIIVVYQWQHDSVYANMKMLPLFLLFLFICYHCSRVNFIHIYGVMIQCIYNILILLNAPIIC